MTRDPIIQREGGAAHPTKAEPRREETGFGLVGIKRAHASGCVFAQPVKNRARWLAFGGGNVNGVYAGVVGTLAQIRGACWRVESVPNDKR
jgi:hypothetical protein